MCVTSVLCPPASASEIQNRVRALEGELSEKVGTLKSIQNDMVQTKKELAAKELGLQKARDELSLMQTRMAQDREKVKTRTTTAIDIAGGPPEATSCLFDFHWVLAFITIFVFSEILSLENFYLGNI